MSMARSFGVVLAKHLPELKRYIYITMRMTIIKKMKQGSVICRRCKTKDETSRTLG